MADGLPSVAGLSPGFRLFRCEAMNAWVQRLVIGCVLRTGSVYITDSSAHIDTGRPHITTHITEININRLMY